VSCAQQLRLEASSDSVRERARSARMLSIPLHFVQSLSVSCDALCWEHTVLYQNPSYPTPNPCATQNNTRSSLALAQRAQMDSPPAVDTRPDVFQQTRECGARAWPWRVASALAVLKTRSGPPRDFGGQYRMNTRSPADTPLCIVGDSNSWRQQPAQSFELLCGPVAALEHPQLRQTSKQ